jgi:hypothetical protein
MKNLIEPQPKYLALSLPLNPFSLGHSGVGLLAALLIAGCAGVAASGFDKSNTVGRDVDEVIREIESRGFKCGEKYRDKTVFDHQFYGAVNCAVKETTPLCPDSFHFFMSYDLQTKLITSFSKDKRTNCF